jgi:hypothetical protein
LEQVIYFASYIVTEVNEEGQVEAIKDIESVYKNSKIELQKKTQQIINENKIKLEKKEITKKQFGEIEFSVMKQFESLDEEFTKIK